MAGARVSRDHRVEVESFFYSVAHAVVHAEVDLRVTARMIENFHAGSASACTSAATAAPGTDPAHMPSSHRCHAESSPIRFRRWAAKVGLTRNNSSSQRWRASRHGGRQKRFGGAAVQPHQPARPRLLPLR